MINYIEIIFFEILITYLRKIIDNSEKKTFNQLELEAQNKPNNTLDIQPTAI